MHAKGEKRLKEERKLLDALPQLPDLQCAWLLLYFSAVPKANHLLRAVPPNLVHSYAQRHDNEVWRTLLALLNRKPSAALERKKQRAQLPCRLGGCGLRCASRTAPAAYWAAWADVLPTLRERFPLLTAGYVAELEVQVRNRQCLNELLQARDTLLQEGFEAPGFIALAEGAKPEQPRQEELDPGEWRHGWQYFASKTREEHFLENFVRPACTPQEQTLLLSQQGRNNARALTAVPSDPTTTSSPDRFRVTLCRRLRLPFLCWAARCEGCGALLDEYGDHYAACMRSGRVQARAKPAERAWERVLKEARQGTNAAIHAQHLLRNTTLPIRPTDNRRIDLLVTGFPFHSGKPLFCDVTMRSPLKGNGQPHPKAARTGGAVLKRAEQDKQTKYGDVEESPLAELLVLGCESRRALERDSRELGTVFGEKQSSERAPLVEKVCRTRFLRPLVEYVRCCYSRRFGSFFVGYEWSQLGNR